MAIKCLHDVKFSVQDLDAQETFASDFGLVTSEKTDEHLFMKTRGGDVASYLAFKGDSDHLIGMAFAADDEQTLEEAVSRHGATETDVTDMPGIERAVALTDPDGHQVLIALCSESLPAEEADPELVLNTPFNKQRLGRQQIVRELGPARLWRIGHIALFVKSFPASRAWYEEKLGLIGSDIYHVPDMPEVKIVGFFRLNRGEEYVDHHILALMQDETRTDCHHISFETQDFEMQQRTHRHLLSRDYESIWGVGRHPHGCHIFDVWRAPDGARFETFSDTDQYQEKDGTNIHDISQTEMDIWSSEGPEKYFI
jgi:catechol 2,3-dioxygenase-like lactoylglutathione lyase family enzyme